ncbi:MAG: hypothetical protein LBL75_00825 [Rickettsiales bacterium]|jgi:hypothetical protein|nr:hypothetical protein [Rickettsiales bacterium]
MSQISESELITNRDVLNKYKNEIDFRKVNEFAENFRLFSLVKGQCS